MAKRPQQRPRQRRFAGTQIALQVNHQPRFQEGGEFCPQQTGRFFVGQREMRGKLGGMQETISPRDESTLPGRIRALGQTLGFSAIGIADAKIGEAAPRLQQWLKQGFHGGMDYMARHAHLRTDPQGMLPGTQSVIMAALDYLPETPLRPIPGTPVISRYALGRDYHAIMRRRLQQLAQALQNDIGPFVYRVFSDSAPVMEVELACQAGLGWRGKNTLLLSRQGSWRFLGGLYTTLSLPPDRPAGSHCGTCTACLKACPTQAIVAPYQVDARRCISYLTIEYTGSIPEELRPLIGQRIYGCDDCQSCCPWNGFARAGDMAFAPRQGLMQTSLAELFSWGEHEFNTRLSGSPIRRIGHERWLRNIAIALGNALPCREYADALHKRLNHPSSLVREHVAWALDRLRAASPK